jgi:hypothetical protein
MFGFSHDSLRASMALRDLHQNQLHRSIHAGENVAGIRPITSLRQLYTLCTGDQDIRGLFTPEGLPPDLRAGMDITSSTFTYVLGNTLGRALVRDYQAYKLMEDLLVGERKAVADFRQQEAVLVGGFPNLSTVDPEAADYPEIAGVTDEESTYTVAQKGNILTITRKVLVNDDVGLVAQRVRALARAGRRTHAEYVWNLWISNANCSDGTAWHTLGHGNYATSALTHATALTAWQALANMTEKDSGKVLGILADPEITCNLVGPVALTRTLQSIEKQPWYYSGNDLTTMTTNALAGKVRAHSIPLLSDANDWGLLLPPEFVTHVQMGYLGGREEPELIEATAEVFEYRFSADKVAYKIRHEYAGTPVDYRGSYKSEV